MSDSIPFVGEVTEDTTLASSKETATTTASTVNPDTGSSWIFPTAALSQMEDDASPKDGVAETPSKPDGSADETDPNYQPSPQIQALEDRLNNLLNRPIAGGEGDDKADLGEEAQDVEILPEADSDQKKSDNGPDLGRSLQRLGAALFGSNMADQEKDAEADAGVDTDEDDDLLDALLDSDDEDEGGDNDKAVIEKEETNEADILEEAFDQPVEEDTAKEQIPEDSTTRLDHFLNDALDGTDHDDAEDRPIGEEKSTTPDDLNQGNPNDSAMLTGELDDFLDSALEEPVIAPQDPPPKKTAPRAKKTVPKPRPQTRVAKKTATRAPKPTASTKPSTATKNRNPIITRISNPLARRRKQKKSPSAGPPPSPKKPHVPRFRSSLKSPKKPVEEPSPSPRSRKPPVPIFRTPKGAKKPPRSIFSFGSRDQSEASKSKPVKTHDASPSTKASARRSKKILSKLTSWTSSSRSKSSSKPRTPRTPVINRNPSDVSDSRVSPASHQSKDHFSIADRSMGSITSQCTVRSFHNPRRAGIRGCQSQYDPYLFPMKGTCELCVFHLSDQEKARLDATGRHLRVMFSNGGCVDCKVFPRELDEAPVRLCRTCYANSHRTPREMSNVYFQTIRNARRHFKQQADERVFAV